MLFLFELHHYIMNIKTDGILNSGLKRSKDVGERMKEPSTIKNFITILSEKRDGHNLTFTKEEDLLAKEFFQYNNYYNFSIYPRLFPEQEKSYSFTQAITLFQIDELLRKEIHYFTSRIEKWIKTSLAYHLSHMYESTSYEKAELYLDPSIYNSQKTYFETLENFSETLHKSKEVFIEHHFKQRNGCIPIWVLVEELTFGQIDTFLSVLENTYRNNWLDEVFGRENRKFIMSWISVSRYLRNIAAHHGRFYGKKYIVLPKLKKEDMKEYKIKNQRKNTLFVALFVLKNLLSFHTKQIKQEWNLFIDNLEELLNDNEEIIDIHLIGFIEEWKTALSIKD